MKNNIFLILFLSLFLIMPQISYAANDFSRGIVKTNTNLYESASTSSAKMKNDTGGTMTLKYPESVVILGSEGKFYRINVQFNGFYYTGYIQKSTIDANTIINVSGATIDGIIDTLISKGFPRDYAEKLAPIQAIHSNWTFNPINITPSWNTVIAGEYSVKSRNLVANSANVFFRSTDDEVYNNGVYKPFDSGKWYAASEQTIKYYMDARNFINESHLFMFEKLGSNGSNVSKDTVQNILNGTFMASVKSDFSDYAFNYENGEKKYYSYADTILKASSSSQVNAVHLAAKIIQEQGVSGATLTSGSLKDGVKYYNFFNWGATGNGVEQIIENGTNYASSKKWTSPYLSIIGGAQDLANNYISLGQDTVYFQKFSVVKQSHYYWHQYMQNIQDPYKMSYSTYSTYYEKGLLNTPFIFDLPVYSGMPAITTLGPEGNEDNTLKSLSITGCSLMPSFLSNATNYTCNVIKDTSAVTISALPTTSLATISGAGEVLLPTDETIVKVVVTSSSGVERNYNITIKKIDSASFTPAEIISDLGLSNHSGYITGLSLGSNVQDIINTIAYNFPSAVISNPNSGIIKTGDTIKLSNNGSVDYTFVIFGDLNSTGNIDILDLLKIQKHLTKNQSLSGAYLKAADVNKDGKVDILDLLVIQKNILGVSQITQ